MGLKSKSSLNLGSIFNRQYLDISYLEGRESLLSPRTIFIEEGDWNENFMPILGAVLDVENNNTNMIHDYGYNVRMSVSRALSSDRVETDGKTYRKLMKSDFRAVKKVVSDHLKQLPEKNLHMTRLPVAHILNAVTPAPSA